VKLATDDVSLRERKSFLTTFHWCYTIQWISNDNMLHVVQKKNHLEQGSWTRQPAYGPLVVFVRPHTAIQTIVWFNQLRPLPFFQTLALGGFFLYMTPLSIWLWYSPTLSSVYWHIQEMKQCLIKMSQYLLILTLV